MARLGQWRVPAVVAAASVVRAGWWLRGTDGQMANSIPDDAFYYLETARVFARTGRWSFDGVEPASGFHLLWGYLVAAVYRTRPGIGLHAVYGVLEAVQIGCMVVAAWLCVGVARRLFGEGAELGVAVVFLSAMSLMVTGELMEFGLVVLVSAAVVEVLVREEPRVGVGVGFGLGVVGVLARSDSGWLPVCLLVGLVWLRRAEMARVAGAVVAGVVVGWGVVAVHTHWISGGWLQGSARQKLFWAGVQGYSTGPVRRLLLESFDGSAYFDWRPLVGVRVAQGLLLLAVAGLCWQRRQRVWVGCLLAVVLGYVGVYRYNSAAMQGWYLAQFEVPLALLAGAGFAVLAGRSRVTAVGLAVVVCGWGIVGSEAGHTGEVGEFYRAGVYVREHPELRPVGAWNAGTMGYVAGGGVVNLDGLVNDGVHDYAVSGRLLDYVRGRGLRTVMDFPAMVDPGRAKDAPVGVAEKGGYGAGRLWGCLRLEGMVGGIGVYRVECGR